MVRRKTSKIFVLYLDEWEPRTYMGKYLQMCLASPTGSQEFHPMLAAVSLFPSVPDMIVVKINSKEAAKSAMKPESGIQMDLKGFKWTC